jgi:cell division protein ZapD
MPSYHYWLQQPLAIRLETINGWLKPFEQIKEAVRLLLSIIRHSADTHEAQAENGYFHDVLNMQPPSQLIRVSLPKELALYPEMSVGKHRMNIRFMKPGKDQRALQEAGTVKFQLTVCNI